MDLEHLNDLVRHPGWRVLTDKVWFHARQAVMASTLMPGDHEFEKGIYAGYARAQQGATVTAAAPHSFTEATEYEEEDMVTKLFRGIHQ